MAPALPLRPHEVQFYWHDQELEDRLAALAADYLERQDAVLLIATPDHEHGIRRRLAESGQSEQRLFTLGAHAGLTQICPGDQAPEAGRFAACLRGPLRRARAAARSRVLVFGEMAALLWASHRREAALRMERLWNELGQAEPFELVCGYPMRFFTGPEDGEHFLRVCGQHTAVLPEARVPNAWRTASAMRST